MRRVLLCLTALAVVAAACGSEGAEVTVVEPRATVESSATVERAIPIADAPVAALAAGFNEAGFDLFRTLPIEHNTVFSPTSIGHALLMARAAADQTTGAAIDDGLALPGGIAAHDAWNAIDHAVAASNGTTEARGEATPTVTFADRIWPAASFEPNQAWVDLLASHHGADVETIDISEAEESRSRINRWVGEQTNELIPELLPPGFIGDGTLLVLTDAVYFKADWQLPFVNYDAEAGQFANFDGSTTSTAFMRELEQTAPRGRGDGWAAAELPYMGGDYSMLVIVPEDLRSFREGLGQARLDEIDAALTSGPYELLLPRWETSADIDLMPWLREVGAAPGAYPAIGGSSLGGAVHGAFITVDELGTEAAAATAFDFGMSGPPEPEFTIAADRPFLYVIRHVDSGLVLFVGQVTQL